MNSLRKSSVPKIAQNMAEKLSHFVIEIKLFSALKLRSFPISNKRDEESMFVKMVTNRVNGRRDISFIEHLARIRRVLPCQPSTNSCNRATTVLERYVLSCEDAQHSFRLRRRVRNTAREQHGPASAASI